MVKEVLSSSEFRQVINVPNLVVVDYYATWCGPCRNIAPFYEQLSRKYPEVVFLKVGEHNCSDVIMSQGVRAFPTFQFLIDGKVIDELKGANPTELERKVNQHLSKGKASAFSGQGTTLGGGSSWNGVGYPPGSEREARLKALGQSTSGVQAAPAPAPAPKPVTSNSSTVVSTPTSTSTSVTSKSIEAVATTEEDEEEAIARAIAISMSAANNNKNNNNNNNNKTSTNDNTNENVNQDDDWDEEMVPVPVNEENLRQLVELGFEEVRARKGLVHGGDVDGAINWISEHQDDPDIDQPYMVKKKDTIPKAPLTEEEKAAKLAAYKEKIERVKKERELKEKQEEIRREKERRERGQKMIETEEERTRALRKLEAEKAKKEKLDAKLERERIKAELARDKELRRANNGVLPSVLGVEGYNPSAVQSTKSDAKRSREEENNESDVKQLKSTSSNPNSTPVNSTSTSNPNPTTTTTTTTSTTSTPTTVKKASPVSVSSNNNSNNEESSQPRPDIIDSSIATISRYRTGGDGGQALGLLLLFLQNIRDNPEEVKYKSINMESKAYKSKLSPLVGPTALLKAVGFTHRPEEGKLYYEREDFQLLNETITKLSDAAEKYRQLNG